MKGVNNAKNKNVSNFQYNFAHIVLAGMQSDRDINASINILNRGRAGLARTNAQGDICLYTPTGNASGVEELRTYPACAGKPLPG